MPIFPEYQIAQGNMVYLIYFKYWMKGFAAIVKFNINHQL